MKLVVFDHVPLVVPNHVLQQRKSLIKYHNIKENVRVYSHGKYVIDYYKMVFVQMIIYQV